VCVVEAWRTRKLAARLAHDVTPHHAPHAPHRFDAEFIVTRAPGRLDVMGGIADYSGSLVLQMPIAEACHVALQLHDVREQPVWRHVQVCAGRLRVRVCARVRGAWWCVRACVRASRQHVRGAAAASPPCARAP
jgi:hypothetical protein